MIIGIYINKREMKRHCENENLLLVEKNVRRVQTNKKMAAAGLDQPEREL